jgi:hypothetical protein
MAADTAARRYSAINLASPWRGVNVVPDVTIPVGERKAALYLYAGPDAGGGGGGDVPRGRRSFNTGWLRTT